MAYTIGQLAKLAGVSVRTLHHYDSIGLLRPAAVNASGYRLYGEWEVDALQQILFYRALGVSLDDIRGIITAPDFDRIRALEMHMKALYQERDRLDRLIENVQKTLAFAKGESMMTDEEKFAGFKSRLVDDNERRYGKEARARYGDEAVDGANEKLRGMSREAYARMQTIEQQFKDTLKAALATQDPAGELAQQACALHKQWLMCMWHSYSPQAHIGLAQMYVDDKRFHAWFKEIGPGCIEFLRDALMVFCGHNDRAGG